MENDAGIRMNAAGRNEGMNEGVKEGAWKE